MTLKKSRIIIVFGFIVIIMLLAVIVFNQFRAAKVKQDNRRYDKERKEYEEAVDAGKLWEYLIRQ